MTFTSPYDASYPPSLYEEEPEGLAARTTEADALLLPADVEHFTVDAVKTWVGENPDQAGAVLEAEEAHGDAARVTLLDWLNTHIDDEENTP